MRSHHVDNRVAHKSTGGVLPWTPEPVDPVGNPVPLTPNTVALPRGEVNAYCVTTNILNVPGTGAGRGCSGLLPAGNVRSAVGR